MEVAGQTVGAEFRAMLAVSLNPFTLAGQDAAALRKALQDKLSRAARLEELIPRLRTACVQLARLYRPIVEAGRLTEGFFDDVRDEVARELRLMDGEERR